MDRLTGDDAGGLDFDVTNFLGFNGAKAVDGASQGVDDAAGDGVADRHREDLAGALDRVAFFDVGVFTKKGHADVVLFQVEHQTHDAAREFQKLHGHGVLDAVDAGNLVADGQHSASLAHLNARLVVLNLLFDDLADLFRVDLHGPPHPS